MGINMNKVIYVRYLMMTSRGIKLGKREYEYTAPGDLTTPLHGTIVKIKTDPARIGGFGYVNPALVVAVGEPTNRTASRQIVKYTGLNLQNFIQPSIDALTHK